jgi:hypothetical protein
MGFFMFIRLLDVRGGPLCSSICAESIAPKGKQPFHHLNWSILPLARFSLNTMMSRSLNVLKNA